MTGPLAQQFAQVREALDRWKMGGVFGDNHAQMDSALAALSVIERHLQDMETALDAAQAFIDTMGMHHSLVEGREVPRGFTSDSGDAAVVLFDALAALPAREKGEE